MVRAISDSEWENFVREVSAKQNKKVTTTTIKTTIVSKTVDESLISIPLDKLFEFYANLILSGFEVSEALEITGRIAGDGANSNSARTTI